MTLDEIRRQLEQARDIPHEALAAAVGVADALAPPVIELMQRMTEDDVYLLPGQERLLVFGIHALAAAGATSAYRPFVDLLSLGDEELDPIFGDTLSENGVALLLGLYDGDPEPLYMALEELAVGETIGSSIFEVLARLVWAGRIDRARFLRLLDRFDREEMALPDDLVWLGWEDAIAGLGLLEFEDRVRRGWEAGRMAHEREIDRQDWLERLKRAAAEPQDSEYAVTFRKPLTEPTGGLRFVPQRWLEPEEPPAGDGDPARAIRLSAEETDWLRGFMASTHVPSDAMTAEEIDGYFTALLLGPPPIPPDYLDEIWTSEEAKISPSFGSAEQEAFVHDLLRRHWQTILTRFEAGFAHWPLGIDEDGFDLSFWADGFLRPVIANTEAWETRAQDKKIGPIVRNILGLSHVAMAEDEEAIPAELIAKLVGGLPNAIGSLVNSKFEMAWRGSRNPARSDKVGRNQPCPCGSGRKYKKCCGAAV
jgi:uncharacterized protein